MPRFVKQRDRVRRHTRPLSPDAKGPASPSPPPTESLPDLPLVEIDVDAGPSPHWIRDVTEQWNLRARIDVCRPMGESSSELLQVVELIGDPGDLGAAERHLRRRTDLQQLTVLSPSPSRRFIRAVTMLPESCRRVFEAGAICGTCRFVSQGRAPTAHRWTLVVPRNAEALRAASRAPGGPKGSPSPILRMRRFVPARTLTPRQATALETAYRLGFYSFPRRSNLREISRILGVSRSTTAELLRRAENKMLAHQLGEP